MSRTSGKTADRMVAERATIHLTIDGQPVAAAPGTTILQAAAELGVQTPTLCHHPHMHCGSNCRACVVEVEGARVLAPSCSREVSEGMQVRTDSERVRRARRMVFDLLLSEVELGGAPELLAYAGYYGANADRFPGTESAAKSRTVIIDNPFFVRDYARCIACQRCTQACGEDVQHTFAIAMIGRGHQISVGAGDGADDLAASPCVFCGNCVGACPTGALSPIPEYELRVAGELPERRLTWSPERGLKEA